MRRFWWYAGLFLYGGNLGYYVIGMMRHEWITAVTNILAASLLCSMLTQMQNNAKQRQQNDAH